MSNFIIIGGSGFVGSHLVNHLISTGQKVTVIDVVPPDNAVRLRSNMQNITYVWKSIHDIRRDDLLNADYIINLASQADVPLALSSPNYTYQQNIMGLVNLLEELRKVSFKKFIYLSSENVYGNVPPEHIPIREDEPLRPANPYGASKAAADLTCQAYARAYGLPITVLRSSTVYGPYSRLRQVIPIFIRQAIRGQPITIEGEGDQTRDFNYVTNLVDGIILACHSNTVGVFNIASGRELSILQVAQAIIKATDSDSPIIHVPWRAGERGLRLALDIEKAKRILGYSPKVSFEEGLKATIAWIKQIEGFER